jgi:hypothetical protein
MEKEKLRTVITREALREFMKLALTFAALTGSALALAQSRTPTVPSPRPSTPTARPSPAPRLTQIGEIRVKGMREYSGKYLHVFYASARQAALGVVGQELKIRQIKHGPVSVLIDARGEAMVPAVVLTRSGFYSTNNVIFAVSASPDLPTFLKNSDGTCPLNARGEEVDCSRLREAELCPEKLKFADLLKLDELRDQKADGTSVIEIDWNRDF